MIFRHSLDVKLKPQFEITGWSYFNCGIGIGYLYREKVDVIYNIFLGFPYSYTGTSPNLSKHLKPFNIFYMEPFYRLSYYKKEILHEVGLMLKINTFNDP